MSGHKWCETHVTSTARHAGASPILEPNIRMPRRHSHRVPCASNGIEKPEVSRGQGSGGAQN